MNMACAGLLAKKIAESCFQISATKHDIGPFSAFPEQ